MCPWQRTTTHGYSPARLLLCHRTLWLFRCRAEPSSRLLASHVATLFHALVTKHDVATGWQFLQKLGKIADKVVTKATEAQVKPKPLKLKAALAACKKAEQAATGA